MDSLERISRIDRSLLSGEHYLTSLLEQAFLAQVLSASQIEAVQMACLSVLARQTQLYNGMESSSVRVEEAESIFESALFTIGICLKQYENAEDAALALVSEGAEALFVRGGKKIDRMLKTTRLFHAGLVRRLMETPNVFYRSTVKDGINGFFHLYRPQFGAQQIHITADYPLLHPVTDLVGVEFIREYVERVDCENQFCTCFSPAVIHRLLCGLPVDYRELPLNLCGPVLTAALGCVLCGKNPFTLQLSEDDLIALQEKLSGRGNTELLPLLQAAFEKVNLALSLRKRTAEYLAAALPGISAEAENAVRTDTLPRLFLIARLPQGGY
ncbi:DUF6179 domain-containing protein [Faecalispora anaeroviscerum]|uniref:DUF6179 domain-containing protein n=1 Tax=Faecalispora anaeroviscerum TaxID=2991836 RepID=UPI0024B880C3|nr:DUF6179 domain-containing protein [Faecalispora anaeroviscerum]